MTWATALWRSIPRATRDSKYKQTQLPSVDLYHIRARWTYLGLTMPRSGGGVGFGSWLRATTGLGGPIRQPSSYICVTPPRIANPMMIAAITFPVRSPFISTWVIRISLAIVYLSSHSV